MLIAFNDDTVVNIHQSLGCRRPFTRSYKLGKPPRRVQFNMNPPFFSPLSCFSGFWSMGSAPFLFFFTSKQQIPILTLILLASDRVMNLTVYSILLSGSGILTLRNYFIYLLMFYLSCSMINNKTFFSLFFFFYFWCVCGWLLPPGALCASLCFFSIH